MRLRSERLPWLEDAPPAVPAKAAPQTVGRSMWPWYLLLLLLVAAVAAGAWWLSTAKEAPPPVLPAEESIPVPINRQETVEGEAFAADEAANFAEPMAEVPPPPPARSAQSAPAISTEPLTERSSAGIRETGRTTRGVFPADEPAAAAPEVTGPTPIILYHPQPNRGRVVQLGAFPTRAQAEVSWRRITRRYPYLATKPKMVNTVDVRGLGGGRPTRMYRLQFGTSSQAQSVVICQQLERAGHSCVVVY